MVAVANDRHCLLGWRALGLMWMRVGALAGSARGLGCSSALALRMICRGLAGMPGGV